MISGARNGAAGNDDVSTDVMRALEHDRREKVVERLSGATDGLSLVALASHIAADTEDTLPDVVIELHDVHIPDLTDRGLVEYDDDTGVLTLVADPDVVETALDTAEDDDSTDRA